MIIKKKSNPCQFCLHGKGGGSCAAVPHYMPIHLNSTVLAVSTSLLTFRFQRTTCLKAQLELVCNTDVGQSSHLHLYCLSCGFHTHMQLLIKMVPIPLEYQIFILL